MDQLEKLYLEDDQLSIRDYAKYKINPDPKRLSLLISSCSKELLYKETDMVLRSNSMSAKQYQNLFGGKVHGNKKRIHKMAVKEIMYIWRNSPSVSLQEYVEFRGQDDGQHWNWVVVLANIQLLK